MYSSSPNLIKHYVPINFSQASLDYNPSSPKKYIQSKLDQNPFTNTKLKKLHNKPNDFVLIFKNKTCKDYIAKKKIKYSNVLKIMRKKNDQVYQSVNKQQNKQFIQNMQLCESNKFEFVRSRRTYSMDKFRQFRQFKEQRQQCNSPNNKSNRNLLTRYSSVKQRNLTAKSAKQNQNIKNAKNAKYKKEHEVMAKSLINFKIRGIKAPESQTVDFLKKMRLDSAYTFADKLIN